MKVVNYLGEIIDPSTGGEDYGLPTYQLLEVGDAGALQPFIASISPNLFDTSATNDIVVEGAHFDENTTFSFTPAGLTVNSINVISDTEAILNVTSSAAVQFYTIEAQNGVETSFGTPVTLEVKDITLLMPGDGTTNWQNITAGTTVGLGTIEGSSVSSWNKQATFGTVPANTDCVLEFVLDSSTDYYGMFGFGVDPTANTNYNTIDHALYLYNGGNTQVRENGTSRGDYGSTVQGDKIEIKRNSGTVTYWRNGTLLYTSTVTSIGVLHFDCSIYRNAKLKDIKLYY